MRTPKPAKQPGRPRAFDEDAALESAMEVFWRKGYDAASLADLTAAMGINPPSLYAAFGNKESLFLRVLERYGEGPASYYAQALAAPTAREVAKLRLYGAVAAMFDRRRPPGCLAVQTAMKCGDQDSVIGQKLRAFFETGHRAFVERFRRAKAEGDLPPDADPVALTRFVNGTAHGIAIQAATGVSRAELQAVADLALMHFPEKPAARTKKSNARKTTSGQSVARKSRIG